MTISAHLSATLNPTIYPSSPHGAGPFPEFQLGQKSDRYLPQKKPVGVCISGGGPRSYAAAIGQMRALTNISGNFLNLVGSVSSVSGGTWFSTPFFYAPTNLTDAQLLGPLIQPENLTRNDVDTLAGYNLGSALRRLSNTNIVLKDTEYQGKVLLGEIPENRVYSRIIGDLLLQQWGLNYHSVFFSLDGIQGLGSYTIRPDRPYFIANATQVYPTGIFSKNVRRHFEYSPLYSGTSQFFQKDLPRGKGFGGGYISSYGFDSHTPLNTSNPTTVRTPDPIFLLSDVMGSSGAAPGAELDKIGLSDVGFPAFNYWSPVNAGYEASEQYSFVDGGNLEDLGIVPLLRRQYPFIIALVNAELPIGTTSDQAVDGISGQVSRLFGLNPKDTLGNDQDTQVFGATKQQGKTLFTQLKKGLEANQGSGATHLDTYTIFPSNSFDIPAYPSARSGPYAGGGQVRVLWVYLDKNEDWINKIQDSYVRHLLNSSSFSNFPNYNTAFQNFGELLLLTTQQIQLLSHMTSYTLNKGKSAEALMAFQSEVESALNAATCN